MAEVRLDTSAFEYYVGLGAARSYDAVARHFGVTKRTVARRAKEEVWQERIREIERDLRSRADASAMSLIEARQLEHLTRTSALHEAIHEVITPQRMKALVAALLNAAVKEGDVGAARLLVERVLGKPRNESLAPVSFDLPDGLESARDVRKAANSILQAVAEGSLAPEDAQRAAGVLESARKSVETEDLERRIEEIEARMKEGGP